MGGGRGVGGTHTVQTGRNRGAGGTAVTYLAVPCCWCRGLASSSTYAHVWVTCHAVLTPDPSPTGLQIPHSSCLCSDSSCFYSLFLRLLSLTDECAAVHALDRVLNLYGRLLSEVLKHLDAPAGLTRRVVAAVLAPHKLQRTAHTGSTRAARNTHHTHIESPLSPLNPALSTHMFPAHAHPSTLKLSSLVHSVSTHVTSTGTQTRLPPLPHLPKLLFLHASAVYTTYSPSPHTVTKRPLLLCFRLCRHHPCSRHTAQAARGGHTEITASGSDTPRAELRSV